MPIIIDIADLNSQAIEATLDDVLFYIIVDWNDSGKYWEMGIRNSSYRTLIDGICMVSDFGLTRQFRYSDMPAGELVVNVTKRFDGALPRDAFVTGLAQLTYTTEQELLDLGVLEALGRTSPGVV